MQRIDGRLVYAASDLNDYLECNRLTELEALVARHKLVRPQDEDSQAELLRRKGDEHELRYLEEMRTLYPGQVVEFKRAEKGIEGYRQAELATVEAMRAGAPIIYQATFFDGQFLGHADFLRRVPMTSNLGDYGYEVIDTKLGLGPKPYYLVQLCNYSEHVERLQGRPPQYGHVVFGDGAERAFRVHDYVAYYHHLKEAFLAFVGRDELDRLEQAAAYPIEVQHCAYCPWEGACELRRRHDDHLSLVAWMRRDQIAKLEAAGITRVAELAYAPEDARPTGMVPETFGKLRRQALLQVRGRDSARPIYELLEHAPPLGFALLPEPAEGDVFFDMEGDPLFDPGRGLEYLFGCWMPDDEPQFRAFWGVDREAERCAFEQFVDFILERRKRYPKLHVYHFANYEKNALRKLAQLHCTREDEVDDLLRGEVLVDLFAVVRQSLLISEESYGLKNIERFYGLEREADVKKGDQSIVMFESWLFTRDRKILDDIERYNREDCLSTFRLREWLLQRRVEAIGKFGIDLPHREPKSPDAPCHAEFTEGCKSCAQRRDDAREEARRSHVERELLAGVRPLHNETEYDEMPTQRRIRYLLGNLMAYHRREEKPAWWAFFDRCENVDRLAEFDRDAIGQLELRANVEPYALGRSTVYTYTFPDQLYKLGEGDGAVNPRTRKRAGTILSIDHDECSLELKTTAPIEAARAITELIPDRPIVAYEQRDALARIGASFLDGSLELDHPATYDLLANRNPRLVSGARRLQPTHVTSAAISAVVAALDRSYLFIQGPPGSGKSTFGSQVICDLLQAGRRVAVTSTSHKAIHNLLQKVEECATERGARFRGRYKHSASNAGSQYISRHETPFIESVDSYDAFAGDDYHLAGGTAWLCAREGLDGKFDYLFIDEAGQVSLADALAMSLCARNVVLLGDPSQLAQVSQGRQPLHVGDSVLQHLLGDAPTVPKERGIFLEESYRMSPEVCAFVSDAMYENRLLPAEATRTHRILTNAGEYAGLYFLGIEHAGNSSQSPEEADAIVAQVWGLLDEGRAVDSQGPSPGIAHKVGLRDILIITPYNAQRRLITRRLRDAGIDTNPHTGLRVGTVDKLQGQEAAIVFYSMATSSGEDIPRNVEFLFERNRFNVAISRSRAASVLLCSPRLLDIRCRTPEEMALANLLCAFAERAKLDFERPALLV
jgi:predicted RecB family nuclease